MTYKTRNQRATRHGDPWKDKPLPLNPATVANIVAEWARAPEHERAVIAANNPEIDFVSGKLKKEAE
jgi:hypothetical protein